MNLSVKSFLPFLILASCLTAVYLMISPWKDDAHIQVSGTIEENAVVINLAYGGQVAEVLVADGEAVKAGEVLLKLEDDLLEAQYRYAETELLQATADYHLLDSQPLQEQRQVAIANAELEALHTRQLLKALFDNAEQARAGAQKELEQNQQALEDLLDPRLQQALAKEKIASAEKAWDSANRKFTILTTSASQAAIDQAYANLLLAESVLDKTKEDLEWAKEKLQGNLGPVVPKEYYIDEYKSGFRQTVQALEIKLSQDQLVYEHAQAEYKALFEPPDPVELALSEAALAVAEAQLEQAQREYLRVAGGPSQADIALLEAKIEAAKRDFEEHLEGPDPDDLALANARVKQAEAKLALAKADTIEEKLAVAQARIESAKAVLGIIKAQLDKLVITAPFDGIMLDHQIEVGEIMKPGAKAFSLSRVNQLTITFFFPEEYYQNIQQESAYQIQVDAFPDLYFNAQVIQKSDRDESLPRNATSKDNRSQAVFAVQLAIEDPRGILKPGMMAHLDTRLEENLNE